MAITAELLGRGPIPVSSTEVSLPPQPTVIDIPKTEVRERQNQNGVEYEKSVVRYIESTLAPDRMVIGPGLIDKALIGIGDGIKLPDAMVFRPVGDGFQLEELMECRRGRLKSATKMSGIKLLVNLFRDNPNELRKRFSSSMNQEMPRLTVPQKDSDLEMHFVSPRLPQEGTIWQHDTDFKVFYWTYPNQEAA